MSDIVAPGPIVPVVIPPNDKPAKKKPFRVVIRGIRQAKTAGRVESNHDPIKALDAALAVTDYPEPEPVIEWDGKDRLAVLDIDFHNTQAPTNPESLIINVIRPRPVRWWVSHGGGLKLVYVAGIGIGANDLAAIARMIARRGVIGESGMEIQSGTRHPAYPRGEDRCGSVSLDSGDGIADARRVLLGDIDPDAEVDPERLQAWLDENGFARGQRYPHDRCLIDPNDKAERNPVQAGDRGIYCHRCAGKGVCFEGIRKPGFVPYAVLIDDAPARVHNPLRLAVRGLCHWEHARHFIDDKEGYAALLKLWHVAGKPLRVTTQRLVNRVFFPPIRIVRTSEQWFCSDTLTPATGGWVDDLIRQMPAVQFVKGKGRINQQPVMLGNFRGPLDLSEYGYAPVIPLRGVDMAEHVRPVDAGEIYAAVPASPAFRYREPGTRDLAEAEATIQRCFPSVNLNLLRLVIAAKGLIQRGDLIDVPQIFITGQSGSGKSIHARLAAHIACDRVDEIRFAADPQRHLQAYADASDSCSFALFNEASKSGIAGTQLRDLCLSFARGMKYHRLYAGQRRIDNPAVVIMTDPEVPADLEEDTQTARRIALVDIGAGVNAKETVDWMQTCGTGTVERWRERGFADTADIFLSDIIDRYFRDSSWGFRRIVESLGFRMMEQQAEDVASDYCEFYRLVMELPEHDKSSRWQEDDWRVFLWDSCTPVADLYRELTNNNENFQSLHSKPWGVILKQPGMVCKVRVHRRRAGVRFRRVA